ncbi:ABC transporter permease [Actinophytocola gossypii]|uniref:ABC transporter permease n=1 Tax=Actinophytocola gossypii TaxID=2812003 RepID=UPI0021A30A1E|nr:ABC-2 family transporter protein [Actinophytocola gossypii]
MTGANASRSARVVLAVAGAGFRRYSTYRQATVAGAFTNTVFGFMRCYVLLSVAGVAGEAGGYDRAQLATFVWVGQGLLSVVNFWNQLDLAERVRSGDVVSDLLRPMDLMTTYVATDAGRAAYAMLTRFVVPVGVGMLAFGLYLPANPVAYLAFAVSVAMAVVICSLCRYLVGLTAFWLLDVRGVSMLWMFAAGAGSGLYFPLPLLPDWLVTLLWVATPFPALLQAPLDVLVERGPAGPLLAGQLAWLAVTVVLARIVQRRGLRRLVIQGG